jgi:CheY-like chemotaxis protein
MSPATAPVRKPEAARRIVLIAEDDPDTLEYIRASVEHAGHEVYVAEDGNAAIKQVEALQPDLVVLDIMMPGREGTSVCSEIKNSDILKRIKVILCTAMEKKRAASLAKKAGADALINKPFDPETLWSMMATLFTEQDKESTQLIKKLGL